MSTKLGDADGGRRTHLRALAVENVAVAFVAVASLLGGRWLLELSKFFAEFAGSALGDQNARGAKIKSQFKVIEKL